VSSGRGVHEALAGSKECAARGVAVGVIDMPSIDESCLLRLCDSGKLIVFAEQNNGYLWQHAIRTAARHGKHFARILALNALTQEGRTQYIHSGTYEQLLDAFSLSPAKLAARILEAVQ
jgi:transketolase C-terminal domain/subunit